MSVKIHDLFARKRGTTMAEFSGYWSTTHAAIAKRFPQIRHYTQSHSIEEQPLVSAFGASWPDGCAETWYVDPAAIEEMVASPEFSALMEDERQFMNLENPRPLLASVEQLIDEQGFDPGDRGVKLLLFAAKRANVDDERFIAEWARPDDVDLGRTLGVTRHILCTPVRGNAVMIQSDPEAEEPPTRPYDAIRELWWASQEQFTRMRAEQSDAWGELLRLSAVDASRSMTLLTRERVMIP